MTLTATAKNFAKTEWTRGPGDLWLNVALPTNGRITLFTDGTPEATANPDAVHIGGTVEGCKMTIKGTEEDEYIDEFDGPVDNHRTQTDGMIEGAYVQIRNYDLMELINQAVTRMATATGIDGVTFGNKKTTTLIPVAHIARIPGTAFYQVFMLYAAKNGAGNEFSVQKTKRGESPFSWKGYSVTTRADGDSMGSFWEQTA